MGVMKAVESPGDDRRRMVFFPKDKKMGTGWQTALNATTLGIHIVTATFVGFITGWYLDKWLETKPWLTVLMLVLGVAAGFKNVFQEVRKIQRAEERQAQAERDEADKAAESAKSAGPEGSAGSGPKPKQ